MCVNFVVGMCKSSQVNQSIKYSADQSMPSTTRQLDPPTQPETQTHLRVREDSGDVEAARALHVHEERVGALDQPLQLL